MMLSEILKPEYIKMPLEGTTKTQAIKELVELLSSQGKIADPPKVLDAVLTRENARSTGVGSGLAIPHGRSDGVKNMVIAIGKAETPIDFQSVDGRPVTWVWLLLSPMVKDNPHIQILSRISRVMGDAETRLAMFNAKNPQEVFDIITKKDGRL